MALAWVLFAAGFVLGGVWLLTLLGDRTLLIAGETSLVVDFFNDWHFWNDVAFGRRLRAEFWQVDFVAFAVHVLAGFRHAFFLLNWLMLVR